MRSRTILRLLLVILLVRDNVIMQNDVLPLRPIAAPFAVNTVFYAAIFAFLLFGAPAIRRRLRQRGGRCATCNYPVGTSTACPECGCLVGRRSS